MKSDLIKKQFEEIANQLILNADCYTFQLNDLPQFPINFDIRENPKFQKIFIELDKKKTNCIYWLTAESVEAGSVLKKKLDAQRIYLNSIPRKVPTKNNNLDSQIIYVGVRQGGFTKKYQLSNLSARIGEHLGYYRIGTTQGLQLAHWAREFEYQIILNVVELEDLPNQYLTTLEKIIAFKLKPLCGIH